MYAEKVAEGRIMAGKLGRLACERHLRDLESAHKRGFAFDPEAADRILRFFPTVLRHSKGEWARQPVVLAPWQKFRLASVFGWKKKETGFRRFRTAYHAVARKNGKSTETGGVGLFLLAADGEPGAEVYSYATKRDQAKILWSAAKAMVKYSPGLSARLRAFTNRISYAKQEAWFDPLGQDADSMDGLNVHGGLGDELHAQKSGAAYDVIDTAMGARRQPLHWLITTRGSDRASICGDLDDYSERVLKGEVHDDRWFAWISALDDGDDWLDEAVWPKANPNLGVSVKIDDLRRLATAAKEMPSRQNEFRRKRCNLWTGSASRWIDYGVWSAAGGDVDDDQLDGCPMWAGLDLSSVNDLTALVMAFELPDGTVVLRCRFWTPEKGLEEREKRDRVPYALWVRQGWLETVPGSYVDRRYVARQLAETFAKHRTVGLGYDRWRIKELLAELDEISCRTQLAKADEDGRFSSVYPDDGLPLVEMGQGFRDMTPCVDEFETLIGAGKLLHGGNPVLAMCAANAVLQADPAGNRKFAKNRATGRIDGVVAGAMALGLRKRLPATQAEMYSFADLAFV